MAFLRGAWRLLMVVKDALVLLFLLLFFGTIYAALTVMKPSPAPVRGALLVQLDGVVVEQPAGNDPFTLLSSTPAVPEVRLRDVVHAIETAARDPQIKAVVVDLSRFMGAGQTSAQRIGMALDRVRKAGKPVLTYALQYSDGGYAIAAHASEIWLSPLGVVAATGPGGSQPYYKGLIDRLGITTHIYRVGTFKSFVEPYIRADQSPEAEAADVALNRALWADWLASVGRARPKARIAAYVGDPMAIARDFGGDPGKAALTLGMVDRLGDEFAFADRVAAIAGPDADGRPGGFAATDMADYLTRHRPDRASGRVGVVTVAGMMIDGNAGPGTAGGDSIATIIADALGSGDIRALVVRVDSPGGSVTAAETIRQAMLQARKANLPVVVSMGDVAASGGYWISTAADAIYAEPGTITGSIGVFGILPSFEGALAKIGVTSDGTRTTPLSGEPDFIGGFSPTFNAVAQATVAQTYRRFVALVAGARRLTPAQAEGAAEGRVWDGSTARQLRLVDRFGTLDDAVADAARRAKLTGGDARPRWLDPKPDPLSLVAAFLGAQVHAGSRPAAMDWLTAQARRREATTLAALADARNLLTGPAIRVDCLPCRDHDWSGARANLRTGAFATWLANGWLAR